MGFPFSIATLEKYKIPSPLAGGDGIFHDTILAALLR
jgi:hypothetical protein